MEKDSLPKWFKNRGYIHVSQKLDLRKEKVSLLKKTNNPKYVEKHGFFPLLHANIRERRYKIIESNKKRGHVDKDKNPTAKLRPLHFATHIDSMIFACYAEKLQTLYEERLSENKILSETITAYRKVPDPNSIGKNKNTIHFAKESFDYIKSQALGKGSCAVLKLDIKSFFNEINHEFLKKAWADLLKTDYLPKDHYKVFRAATSFSYILKDDLRSRQNYKSRKSGFDEKKLASIRKTGLECFFESNSEFRDQIKNGTIKIYKNPFWSKEDKCLKGIPQGLPISAVLANLYLYEFDKKIVEEILVKHDGFYRRYSDDIILVIPLEFEDYTNSFVNELIKKSKVEISTDKTEIFHFKSSQQLDGTQKVEGFKKEKDGAFTKNIPLNYLGFDFYGYRTLVAGKNLSKFYRRMKFSIKRKVKIAFKMADKSPDTPIAIYQRQLYKIYSDINLDQSKIRSNFKILKKNIYGDFIFESVKKEKKFKGNYFSYIRRVSEIMNEPAIARQLKNHRKIFNKTLKFRIDKAKQRLVD